jgi:hypothetical protein
MASSKPLIALIEEKRMFDSSDGIDEQQDNGLQR